MDVLVAKSHSTYLMAYVYSLYQQQKACDVSLVSQDGVSYSVHVLVLTATSTYLQKLWSDNRLADGIRLDIPSQVLQALIEFAYTGQLFVNPSERAEIVSAARLLQMYSALDLLNTETYSMKWSTQSTDAEVKDKPAINSCYVDLSSSSVEDKQTMPKIIVIRPSNANSKDAEPKKKKPVGRPCSRKKDIVDNDANKQPSVKEELVDEQALIDQMHSDNLYTDMAGLFDNSIDGDGELDDTTHDPDFDPTFDDAFADCKTRRSKRICTRLKSRKSKPARKCLKNSKGHHTPYAQIKSVKGSMKIKIAGLKFKNYRRKELKTENGVKQALHTHVFVPNVKDRCSCRECGARFPAFVLLRRHLILSHRNTCPDMIMSQSLVARAARCSMVSNCSVDSSKRIFTCNVCAKQFPWYSGFRRHFCNNHLKLLKHCKGMFLTVAQKYKLQRKLLTRGRDAGLEKKITKQTSSKPRVKSEGTKEQRLKDCECLKCHKFFVSNTTLAMHMRKMHNASADDVEAIVAKTRKKRKVSKEKCVIFQCPDCQKYMLSQIALFNHLKTVHHQSGSEARQRQHCLAQPLDCEVAICPFQSHDLTLMRVHVQTAHTFIQHMCSQCSAVFQLKLDMERHHYKRHVVPGPCNQVCSICDKRFPKSHRLHLHQFNKHGIKHELLKVYHCDHDGCDYAATNPTTVRIHQQRHIKDKPFTCEFCNMKLKTAVSHAKHVKKMHLGIRPFMCEVCGQSFGEVHELKSHYQNKHQTEHTFHCEYCPYATSNKGTFYTHLYNVHKARAEDDNRKEYHCPHCPFVSILHHRYQTHMNGHTNTRTYHCVPCEKSFISSSTLRSHNQWLHSDTMYSCSHCGYQTKTSQKLNEHVRVQHQLKGFKPYKCPYCNFRCATGGNTRKHVKQVHRGQQVTYIRDDHLLKAARYARQAGQTAPLAQYMPQDVYTETVPDGV